jgi:hypothetical protein
VYFALHVPTARPNASEFAQPSGFVLPNVPTSAPYSAATGDVTPPGMAGARTRPIGDGTPSPREATARPASRTCRFVGCTHYVVDHGLCVRHGVRDRLLRLLAFLYWPLRCLSARSSYREGSDARRKAALAEPSTLVAAGDMVRLLAALAPPWTWLWLIACLPPLQQAGRSSARLRGARTEPSRAATAGPTAAAPSVKRGPARRLPSRTACAGPTVEVSLWSSIQCGKNAFSNVLIRVDHLQASAALSQDAGSRPTSGHATIATATSSSTSRRRSSWLGTSRARERASLRYLFGPEVPTLPAWQESCRRIPTRPQKRAGVSQAPL